MASHLSVRSRFCPSGPIMHYTCFTIPQGWQGTPGLAQTAVDELAKLLGSVGECANDKQHLALES